MTLKDRDPTGPSHDRTCSADGGESESVECPCNGFNQMIRERALKPRTESNDSRTRSKAPN